MADHLIIQIRDALVGTGGALRGLVTTGTKVFYSRPVDHVLQDSELPALWVELGDEQVEETTLAADVEVVSHTLAVMACVKESGDWEKKLYTIAKEVRHAVAANRGAGGAMQIAYLGASRRDASGLGLLPAGRLRMDLRIDYATPADAVDTAG